MYLQSGTERARDVYLDTLAKLDIGPHRFLRVVQALYGITDAGDYWGINLRNLLTKDTGMRPFPSDTACYANIEKRKLGYFVFIEMDGILMAGTAGFYSNSDIIEAKSESKPVTHPPSCFAGIYTTPLVDSTYGLEQASDDNILATLPDNASFGQFR